MNGLSALKMQKIFKALVPESVYSDARNLVEYCCFRFLSRDGSDFHPSLKVCGNWYWENFLILSLFVMFGVSLDIL